MEIKKDFDANDFIAFLNRVRRHGNNPAYWKALKLSTDELKRLWDSYDGIETSDPEIGGEEVHCILNERGEGEYCAV